MKYQKFVTEGFTERDGGSDVLLGNRKEFIHIPPENVCWKEEEETECYYCPTIKNFTDGIENAKEESDKKREINVKQWKKEDTQKEKQRQKRMKKFDKKCEDFKKYTSLWSSVLRFFGKKMTICKELTEDERDDDDRDHRWGRCDDKSYHDDDWNSRYQRAETDYIQNLKKKKVKILIIRFSDGSTKEVFKK